LREAIFFFWETRELGKFDAKRRHSAAARALANDRHKRYDHAMPLRLLLPDVLTCQTVDELRQVLDRIQVVIITDEEDQALTRAGLRQRMPEAWEGRSAFDR
jgi:DNA-binding NarL/FixJ family response regulator